METNICRQIKCHKTECEQKQIKGEKRHTIALKEENAGKLFRSLFPPFIFFFFSFSCASVLFSFAIFQAFCKTEGRKKNFETRDHISLPFCEKAKRMPN